MGKRELVALLSCIVVVVWLFAASWVCLQFVIVVFPDHTHLLFLVSKLVSMRSNRASNISII